jgi:hypothetical protein
MLGISLEHRLGKACGKMFGRTRAIRKAADNLKGLLVRIMAKGRSDAGGTDHHGMKGFISAADRVVSCIEALQIINASLLEREQACLFQIPVALYEGGTGVAEVFVKREDRGKGNEGSKKGWTLHCLLTMDALGDIAVDARFEKKTVACSISCGDEATGAFIHGHMEELRERLVHAGYHVGAMGCVIKADRREERDAWLRLLNDNDHPGVNVVA